MNGTAATILALSSIRPVRSLEDVPLSLALYPWLELRDGEAYVDRPGERRHGKRWGASGSYDPRREHYMLPPAVLALSPPSAVFAVTAAPAFDIILDHKKTWEVLGTEEHRRYHRAMRAYAIDAGPPPLELCRDVFRRTLARTGCPHMSYPERFEEMLELVLSADGAELPVRFLGLWHGADYVGFQILWEAEAETMQVFRYILPEHISAARAFDAAALAKGRRLNLGGAFRLRSLMNYRLALRPVQLRGYFNVLSHDELADFEQRDARNEKSPRGNPGGRVPFGRDEESRAYGLQRPTARGSG